MFLSYMDIREEAYPDIQSKIWTEEERTIFDNWMFKTPVKIERKQKSHQSTNVVQHKNLGLYFSSVS